MGGCGESAVGWSWAGLVGCHLEACLSEVLIYSGNVGARSSFFMHSDLWVEVLSVSLIYGADCDVIAIELLVYPKTPKTMKILPSLAVLCGTWQLSMGATTLLMDYNDGNAGNGIHDADLSGGGFDDVVLGGDALTFAAHSIWFTTGSSADQASRTNIGSNGDKTDGSLRSAVLTNGRVFRASTASSSYTISTGDTYDISLVWRDAIGWNDASGTITFSLGYYANEGNMGFDPVTDAFTTFATFTTGTSQINDTWETAAGSFNMAAPAGGDGKTLYVQMIANSGFGRADNITLTATAIPESSSALLGLLGLGGVLFRRRR